MADAGAVTQGEVVRFDQTKGYGFIAPRGGGDDVFLHVNDLLDDKHLVRPGTIVDFVLENGERGPKASSVRVVTPGPAGHEAPPWSSGGAATGPHPPRAVPGWRPGSAEGAASGDAEFLHDLTERLLAVEPALTGPQILAVRTAVAGMARAHGWLTD